MTMGAKFKLAKKHEPAILNALRLLVPRGEVFELRALHVPAGVGETATSAGFFTDINIAARKAAYLGFVGEAAAIYIVMNQRNQASPLPFAANHFEPEVRGNQLTEDCDITRRSKLLIDVDPERPGGCCANTAEKQAAEIVAGEVIDYLKSQGWADPIVIDSGNGKQILYAIDLPNTSQMRDLIRGVLVSLDKQFSNMSAEAKIDTSVYNASRIMRLPGLMNRKGNDTPERPHRLARITDTPPAGLQPVTVKQLEEVAGEYQRYDDVNLVNVDLETIPPARDSDVDRAWSYIQTMPDAISGQRGGDATYAACYRCAEFGLNAEQAAEVMGRFNAEKTGGEPWSGADLSRMVKRAYAYAKTKGALGVKKSVDITINQEEEAGESVGQEDTKPADSGCGVDGKDNGNGKDKGHGGKRKGSGRPKKQPDLRFTDTGNASRFVKQHRGVAQYVAPWKSWVIWDGQKWNRNLKGGVSTLVEKTVASIDGEANLTTNRTERDQIKEWASQSNFLARMQAMEQISRGRLPAMPEDFNRHPWLLNVENGTLDLKTQTLRPHDPADLLTTVSPVTYNPEAQCQHWMSLLKLAFRDKCETVAYLQRLVGYAIVGDVQEHILPILWGGGNNGKSTFVTTILEILGPDLAVQGEKDMMIAFKGDRNSTGLARLWGKRFVAANESGEYGHLDETIVKIATGGDRITARHLYQDLIEFPPTHTIFLVTNHRPVTSGTDRGLWRRLAMIGFEHEIPADVVDTDIRAKLRSEYPGILNWILHGTVEWMKKGLAMPHDVRVTTEEYKKEMDTLGQFIDDRCIVADNAKCLAGRLYDSYRHWAKHCGLSVMPINIFGRKLTDRGFPGRKWKHDRYRYGIAPLEDILWNDEQTGEWQRDLWKE